MKTWYALALYYVAIGTLVVSALAIVWRLIILPPCTQIGNSCVIEPWSVAGLAGTILAVAATVLAILGAVAVAAWWTSLNRIVEERVQTLYESQKKEVNAQVDRLLKEQQKKVADLQQEVVDQLRGVQDRFIEARASLDRTRSLAEESIRLNEEAIRRNEESAAQADEMTEKLKSLEARFEPLKASSDEILRNLDLLLNEMRGAVQSNNLQAAAEETAAPDTNNPTGT